MASSLFLAGTLLTLAACAGMPAGSDADLSDPGIQANLEASLRAQKGLNLRTVTIDVHSKIVTISGLIDTFENRSLIRRIVRETRGVEQVIDNLVIQE